jgi:hypothetical protein
MQATQGEWIDFAMEYDDVSTEGDESVEHEDASTDEEAQSDNESETETLWVPGTLKEWIKAIHSCGVTKDILFTRLLTTDGMWVPFQAYDWSHVYEDEKVGWQGRGDPEEAIRRAQRHTFKLTGELLLVDGDWSRVKRSASHRGIVWAPDHALTQTHVLYYDTTEYESSNVSLVDYINILRKCRSERVSFDARMQRTRGQWIDL